MVDLLGALFTAFSIFLGFCLLRIGVLVLRGNKNEYDRNKSRVKNFPNIINGRVPTNRDGLRDDKVAAGIAVDLRNNSWQEQGRLSDEALRDALAR